ncbi:MAG: glycosyltransferase 87 family protein [Candidatus Sumerlaeota bacterium]|nr:glycosyltransferase 87 family protein [Candidatus Sumerlaeota bacterium]
MITSSAPTAAGVRRLLRAMCWLAFVFMFVKYAIVAQCGMEGIDFSKYYYASINTLHGRAPTGDNYLGFSTPSFSAWMFLFLAPFSRSQAAWVWKGCNVFYILAALALLIRYARPVAFTPGGVPRQSPAQSLREWLSAQWPAAAALILAAFAPLFLWLSFGNIETLNLTLIALFLCAILRGKESVAGVALAAMCLVKILPGMLFIPLAVAGKKRTIGVCLAALGVYGALLLITGGWRWDWILLTRTLPDLPFQYRKLSSSLLCIGGHFFFPSLMAEKAAFDAAARVIAMAVFAATVLALLLSWRSCRRDWRGGVALFSLSFPLITPLLEYHHFIWTLPAYIFLFHEFTEGRCGARFFAASLTLWCIIFCAGYWTDLHLAAPMRPLYIATLATAALWALTAGRLIAKSHGGDHGFDPAA